MKSLIFTIVFLALGVIPAARAADFDAARAWDQLLAQCAFGPRNPGSDGHQECLHYLEAELKKYAPVVERQTFSAVQPVTKEPLRLTNLIARFPGPGTRRVLLCAHWDTRPWADQDPNPENRDEPILGANDGASGVAVLLEIARCLAAEPPPVGVDIVLFDGEDMGREGHLEEYLLGSREYAASLSPPLPEAAILLDIVGGKGMRIPRELYSLQKARRLQEEIYAIARRLNQYVFVNEQGSAVYDDHIPLLEAGIPAVDLIDFSYPYWHTLQDVPANCSPKALEAVGKVVLAWVRGR
ncbi:MAG: M28 family peptidase [Candidatus Zixiibacteriota bacterium]|nr:MAG: M28 family peptidase [candidate division Zixibacteria bacterium]